MAVSHSIKPFPPEIDRAYFGAWLSGFTDGEGCFRFEIINRKSKYDTPRGQFSLSLRCDDTPILELIQSFFQCGVVYVDKRSYTANSVHPKASLRVARTMDLVNIIVPHFESFPLLAKKRRDFVIFKQGIELIHRVHIRPTMNHRGRIPKWTNEERATFRDLVKALKDQRQFAASVISTSPLPPVVHFAELF